MEGQKYPQRTLPVLGRKKSHRISVKEKLPTSELPGVVLVGSFCMVSGGVAYDRHASGKN
jgi:hypothetical protein